MNWLCQKMSKPVTKLEIYVGLVVICVALGGAAWRIHYSIHKAQSHLTQRIHGLQNSLTQNIHGLQGGLTQSIDEFRNDFNQNIHELRCDIRKIGNDGREIRYEFRGDMNVCKDTIREDLIREKSSK